MDMKSYMRFFLGLLLAAGLILSPSCKKKVDNFSETALDSLVIIEELPMEKDYSVFHYSAKNDVLDDAKNELTRIDEKIEKLNNALDEKGEKLEEEALATYRTALEDIKEKRNSYSEKIKAIASCRPEKWDSVKTDVSNAYNIVMQSVENAFDNSTELLGEEKKEQTEDEKETDE